MNTQCVIRRVALVSGFFLVALFALVLLLSMIVDSEAVKARARAFIAEKINSSARMEKIELVWFPRPAVVVRDAAIAFGKEIDGNIQQLTLYPSIRRLLTGNVTFTGISADGAAWRIRLPARNDAPFDFAEFEEKFRVAVKALALAFPGVSLRIHRGAADIVIGAGSPLIIKDIDAELGVAPAKLNLTLSARSNFIERIRLAGEMAASTLVSEARFSVENLDLRQAFSFASPAWGAWVDNGAATLSVNLRTAGLRSFRADIAGAPLSLTLARGTRKALIKTTGIKATVSADEKVLRVAFDDASLISPPLKASGEFTVDRPSSTFALKLIGHDLDAGMIRESVLLLADDVASVRKVFLYLRGGAIAEIRAETRGRSFAEALNTTQAVVTATLRGGKIFVPGLDLELETVAGSLLISGGILECKNCSATVGNAKGRDGALRVGLAGPGAPFHVDVLVESDARELQSLLVRTVKDESFRKELARIRAVDGLLSGRLVLGGTLDAISARVWAVPAGLTASHELVPYPISLKKGRLNYDNGKIEADSLEGAVGRSSFVGLSGSVRADGMGQLNIKSANVQLDLEQSELMLRKVETIQAKLGAYSSARGKIDLASITLTGPLKDPGQWDFTGRGKVTGVLIEHALLPAPLAISQGIFDATHEKLTFAETKAQMLDSSLTAGGIVENWRKAPLRVAATMSGTTGARTMEWVRRRTEVPTNYMPRSPLEFSASRIAWREDTDFSFNGKLTVADGPRLSIDMTSNLQGFNIKELLIDDDGRSARATFESDKDKWGLVFSGTLNEQTIGKIFLTAPMPLGLLQGDFAVNAFRKSPFQLSARGTLAAKDLVSHLKGQDAVIEQILLQGDQDGLNIRSADLRWRRSHISVSGKLAVSQEALKVEMDVSADRLAWDELSEVFGKADGQGEKDKTDDLQLPPLEGVIRLKTDHFAFGGLSWNPLQLTAGLTANGITGEFANSMVCGVRTAGSFTVQNNDQIHLDARLTVKDGDLESTSRCLSFEKSDISGTYSLDAQLKGGGNREQLARTLSGRFDLVARDGKLIRAAGVDATFDYLNRTGDFNVAFPDLNQEAFPYRFISAKGTLERQTIFAQEIIIEASPYAITAQGKADFEQKTIDVKGIVTVLLPAAEIIKSIPFVGSILSGSLVGIPVEVSGSIEHPNVSYLSPAALGAEVLSIPLRILKVPLDALPLFTPGQR